MILLQIVDSLFWVFMLMLFARILGSWIPEFQGHRIMQFIAYYTDPYLNFFRRFIPPIGMMDFSPMIAFLALGFIEQMIKAFIVLVVLRV